MKHKKILVYILIISILLIIWLYFFESFHIPVLFDLNHNQINKLIENLSLAYIASHLFYYIVVALKEKDEKKIIYPFIADYTYVLMNNAILFSYIMRGWGGLDKPPYETSIYNRKISDYPSHNEIKELCLSINPNEKKDRNSNKKEIIHIPHFYGVMIKFSNDIDYFLEILLEKSPNLDLKLMRILTEIKTCGYHKTMSSYDLASVLKAKHRLDDLTVFEKSFNHYFDLFRELESFSHKNLKNYVSRDSLKKKVE